MTELDVGPATKIEIAARLKAQPDQITAVHTTAMHPLRDGLIALAEADRIYDDRYAA